MAMYGNCSKWASGHYEPEKKYHVYGNMNLKKNIIMFMVI